MEILERAPIDSRTLVPILTTPLLDDPGPRVPGPPPIQNWRDVAANVRTLGDRVACAFVGILGLRSINLGYSRSTGDRVLSAALDRMAAAAGPKSYVGRVAGDRFVVAVGVRDWSTSLLDAIVDSLAGPVAAELGEVRMRTAVGVWFGSSSDGIHLLDCADEALRDAIRKGAGSVVIADQHSTLVSRSEALIVSRLDDARSELTPHYQPIVDLHTGNIIGLEALARWTSRDLGEIPPTSWVPLAESSGLIHEFGMLMLHEALDFVVDCVTRGEWGDRYMAVNISPIQLESPSFVGQVLAALAERSLPSSVLLLELTEANTMTDFERIADRLSLLHWHGIRLALDDFGTGEANFEHLRELPLDLLKIDRRFVSGMLDNPLDRAIVRAVLTVASELGMSVLAEGVETTEQHVALLRLGCIHAQGFLYSKARPPRHALEPVKMPPTSVGGAYPMPVDDAHRVKVLRSTGILDTLPDADFDELTRMAAELCEAPIALVSLIDERRQWFKSSSVGMEIGETDRSESFSAHAICERGLFEVPDATADRRFRGFRIVTDEPGIRFYAGVPIGTEDGYPLGTICVLDTKPRELTAEQRDGLLRLGQKASLLLSTWRHRAENRANSVALHRLELEHQQLLKRTALIVSGIDEGVVVVSEDGRVRAVSECVATMVGRASDTWVGQPVWRFLDHGEAVSGLAVEQWFRSAAARPASAAPPLHMHGGETELTLTLHRAGSDSDEMIVLVRPA